MDILPQKLSRRWAMDILPGASGVAWIEHGHAQVGQAERVGQAALLAEVGQGDDEAVDLGGVGLKSAAHFLRVLVGLDRAVGGDFGRAARWA